MKRVLLVCHSQTGQLRRCADTLLAPILAGGDVTLDVFDPKPVTPFPFPWPVPKFLDVMPESVLEIPPPMQPQQLAAETYDLVVFAWQVWYLSPSLPVTAFLQSEQAKVLKDTPVVALCACRNMWHVGWLKLKARLEGAGARILDHIVLCDQGPTWATFISTPRWMWTGKKGAMGPIPEAGVSEADMATLAPMGEKVRDALNAGRLSTSILCGTTPAPIAVMKKYVLPEFLAGYVFAAWARLIRAGGRVSTGLRLPIEVMFLTWLCLSVATLLPILVLTAIVVRVGFKGWFEARCSRLLAPSGGQGP